MSLGFIKENTPSNTVFEVDFKHSLILGETGSGKTTGFINPNLSHRMKLNHGILVFDYKGHYHTHIKALAKKHNRLKDVIIIGEPWGESINILDLLNENGVEETLRILIEAGKENKFWENSAVNLALDVLKIVKLLNYFGIKEYPYNFSSLFKITSSAVSFKNFKEKTKKIVAKKSILKKDYLKAYELLQTFKKVDNLVQDEELESVISGSRRLIGDVLDTIAKVLSKIEKLSFLNTPGINPAYELDNKKIIIIKSNFLGDKELSVIIKAIFDKLLKRFVNFSTPISIFIDEAQKVLNKHFILPIDILREIKVDVILATQSISNLENKIGKEKTKELLANLTNKVYLKGQDSDVEKWFFYTQNNPQKRKFYPLNISKKEAFLAELEFQKMIRLKEKIRIINPPKEKGIYIYSPFLEEDKLIFENMQHKKRIVKYLPKNYKEIVKKAKQAIFKQNPCKFRINKNLDDKKFLELNKEMFIKCFKENKAEEFLDNLSESHINRLINILEKEKKEEVFLKILMNKIIIDLPF